MNCCYECCIVREAAASCKWCHADICHECLVKMVFPVLRMKNSTTTTTNKNNSTTEEVLVFRCPSCIEEHVSESIVARPGTTKAKKTWQAMRSCFDDYDGDHEDYLDVIVAVPGKKTLRCRAEISSRDPARVLLTGAASAEAHKVLRQEDGFVIGIGRLPDASRTYGRPDPHVAMSWVDPKGRAFLSLGDGRVAEMERGWRYVRQVYF